MLDPALKGVTPNFIREIQHRNEVFIEIQDLLAEVNNFLNESASLQSNLIIKCLPTRLARR
ncbi:unnamed protein product [Meloidogyne enterolobii]